VKYGRFLLVLPLFLAGCAAESPYNPLADYEELDAIVAYLRSVPPVRHEAPDEVMPGSKAKKPFVYFGVYRSR
jgi:hypothetical protein